MNSVKLINLEIEVPQNYIKKIELHSEEFLKSRNYQDSSQFDKDKIRKDAYLGKLAEFAVWMKLKKEFECTEPDLTTLEKWSRSWEPDLTAKTKNKTYHISVKSCNFPMESWIFQANFTGRYDHSIFDCKDENHLIYLTQTLSNTNVNLYAVITSNKAIELMRLPRLRKLYGQKLCIYKEDVETSLGKRSTKLNERNN